jgi:aspartyl aminopeptidase
VKDPEKKEGLDKRHYWGLMKFISKKLNVPVEDILELELSLADT